jgi:hypothetical protein
MVGKIRSTLWIRSGLEVFEGCSDQALSLKSKVVVNIFQNGAHTGWSDIYIWMTYKLVYDFEQNRKAIEFTAFKSCQETRPLAHRNPRLRLKRPFGSSCTDSEWEESLFTGRSRIASLMTFGRSS